MTLAKLNQHLELIEKRNKAEEMLSSLRDAAYPRASVITGMPRAPGVRDKVGDLAAEIADLDTQIDALDAKIRASEETVLPFIRQIEDAQTRTVFRLRFTRGLEWKEVATVVGGRNSAESVKMICYRYLSE